MVKTARRNSSKTAAADSASGCLAAVAALAPTESTSTGGMDATKGAANTADEELGGDWIVVTENSAQVSSTPTTTSSPPSASSASPSASPAVGKKPKPRSPPSFVLPAAASTPSATLAVASLTPERLLKLKKQVWQLRICERKSTAKTKQLLAQEHDEILDTDAIESFTTEVESFREHLGLNWTWFQEELERGDYDAYLSGTDPADPGLKELMLPAAMGDSVASPASGRAASSQRGARTPQRTSPKSTPKLQPKQGPGTRRAMPPQEVWLAAKERHKANFFATACGLLPTSKSDRSGGTPCAAEALLFSVLQYTRVGEAINLGLCSQAFAGVLLLGMLRSTREAEGVPGRLTSVMGLWSLLAARDFCGSSRAEPGTTEGATSDAAAPMNELSTPFSGDPAFRLVTWARRCAFTADLASGTAQPATLVPLMPELSGVATDLGPFVPAAAANAGDDRLLVGDGRQSFQVLDVSQLRAEVVTADRYGTQRTLRFSMGVHSTTVTASWSTSPSVCCHLSGGILVGRTFARGTALAKKDWSAPLQWLQLPEFTAVGSASAVSPPASGCASPHLGPDSSPVSPVLGPAAKPGAKPGTKASKSAGVRSPVGPRSPALGPKAAPCSMLRLPVSQEQLAAASVEPTSGAASLFVEHVWPLSEQCAVISVRECLSTSGSPTSGYAPAPRSPASIPLDTPSFPGMQAPPPFCLDSCDVGRQAVGPCASKRGPAGRGTGAAPGPTGRSWLQVWELTPPAGVPRGEVRLEPLAVTLVPSAVTAMDAKAYTSKGRHLLCGLASGGVDLLLLPSDAAARPSSLASIWSWSGEVQYGPVLHTLLVDSGAVPGVPADARLAVIAQAGRVVCITCSLDSSVTGSSSEVLLPLSKEEAPAEFGADEFRVVSLRLVGARGFAVCSDAHAYAFEVHGGGGSGLVAQLTAVVAFSSLAPSEAAEVLYFEATLYEFFVVLDETSLSCPEQNAFVALWPPSGGLEAGQQSPHELRAWVRHGCARLSESRACALCLNSLLLRSKDAAPIGALMLNASLAAGSTSCRADQLAVSAVGPGVGVFWWGVEASPKLQRLREVHREETAQAARQREQDKLHLQLQRCRQKLLDMDRLEARAEEKGVEALTEEEKLKLARREQVTQECDRLTMALGLEGEALTEEEKLKLGRREQVMQECDRLTMALGLEGEGNDVSEEEDSEEMLRFEQAQSAQRRREKEKQKVIHHESKRATQKDRAKRRDQKYTE